METINAVDVGVVAVEDLVETPVRRVYATGVAAGASSLSGGDQARFIEAAMSQAVLDASARGISDRDRIRDAMMAARARAKEMLRDRDLL